MRERYEGKVVLYAYVAVAALYVAFFWGFKYVPTQDGPVHLSSAFVLESLVAGDSLCGDYYELHLSLAPYWAYHAATAPLLAAFRPLVAEKIFISLYLIAFAVAAWYFTKAAAGRPSACCSSWPRRRIPSRWGFLISCWVYRYSC